MTNSTDAHQGHIFLRDGTTYFKIPLQDVVFIEADGNYAHVQTTDQRHAVKRSLASIIENLTDSRFVRVSRGILMNFDRVDTVNFSDGMVTAGDRELKIGKAYYGDIRDRMPRL